ncbi:MAG: polysaccharide pyruvyl transferase family protein [Gammaproteobacteria bacterium]|jgi:polysaccharide pyruvyl transferase WcaK-like protein
MASRKFALYGNFGTQNIGNECTLQTVIETLRERVPQAPVYCVCNEPETVTKDHGIEALRMSMRATGARPTERRRSKLVRAARIACYTIPLELVNLFVNWRQLRGTTDLWIVGTGVLEADSNETRSWMLSFLRWCLAARLRGIRIVFLSIGAGPIESRFARVITKAIFAMATYVSYRDKMVEAYMRSIGFDTSNHRIYPDLAFGLALTKSPAATAADRRASTVAVGVIDASKFDDRDRYEEYLNKLADFVLWLRDRGFAIRMIHGDGLYDAEPLRDFGAVLCARGIPESDTRISTPSIADAHDLIDVIDDADIVVASRYHNIILALARGRLGLGLAYHGKFEALLADFGLEDFCDEVRSFHVERLEQRFSRMLEDRARIESAIRARTAELRAQVDEQYDLLLQAGAVAQ